MSVLIKCVAYVLLFNAGLIGLLLVWEMWRHLKEAFREWRGSRRGPPGPGRIERGTGRTEVRGDDQSSRRVGLWSSLH